MASLQQNVSRPTAARDDVSQAQRVAALWSQPILPDRQAAEVLSLPYSTWAALKRHPGTPRGFHLGRRLYYKTEDLRAWVDALAAKTKPVAPTSQKKRTKPH